MPQLDVTQWPPQLFWLAVTFAALYYIVANHIIPGIGGAIAARRARIEGDLATAQRLKVETDKAVAAYEAAIAEARGKAAVIAKQNRDAIASEGEAARHKLDAELSAKIGAAEQSIAAAKSKALGDVQDAAADIAADIVAKLTGARADKALLAAAVAKAQAG